MDVNVTDISALREFGQSLQWLSGSLVEEFSKTSARMNELSSNWNDSKSASFIAECSVSLQEISRIAEQMEEFSRHIFKKCEILEAYQNS